MQILSKVGNRHYKELINLKSQEKRFNYSPGKESIQLWKTAPFRQVFEDPYPDSTLQMVSDPDSVSDPDPISDPT